MRIEFKKATQDHVNFIHNSWLHSAYLSGVAATDLVRIIPKLLPHTILASVDVDGDECIIGWICSLREPAPCIVYAYVKEPYRRAGVFSSLLAAAFGDKPGILQYCCEGGKLTKLLAVRYKAISNPLFLIGRV